MKALNKIAIILMSMILISGNLMAQKNYKAFYEEDGVEFSYKWKHSKFLKKDSPKILILKIENSNDYHTGIKFTMDYYWKGIRNSSSDPQSICIKSNRIKKGKIRNPTFDKAGFTDEEILSNDFILEFSEVEIVEVPQCKRKK